MGFGLRLHAWARLFRRPTGWVQSLEPGGVADRRTVQEASAVGKSIAPSLAICIADILGSGFGVVGRPARR
jgi:hypothetical protein